MTFGFCCCCRSCILSCFNYYNRNGRIDSALALLGVITIYVLGVQLQHTPQPWESVTLLNQPSSFVDCKNISSLGPPVRTHENSWGALDPVVESLHCPALLASNISSDPEDWLEMCSENHDVYRQYMAQTSKNYLKSILASSDTTIPRDTRLGRDGKPPSFLLIGDSLDKYMAYHICNITGGVVTKIDPPKYCHRRPFVCSSPTLEIGYFNIFGMYKTCDNGGTAHLHDSRSFNSTIDRITALLPDVLKHFKRKPQYVQVGSALWDLSQGCVGRNGVPQSFREDYKEGMERIYEFLISEESGIEKEAGIYGRTSPPVRKSYSAKWVRIGLIPFNVGSHGRTRGNQRILNQLIRDDFIEHHLGDGVVDWWKIARGVSEQFLDKELPDGRHYTFCSCLAFFNEWLRQIIHNEGF